MKITAKTARLSAALSWPLFMTMLATLLIAACSSRSIPSVQSDSSRNGAQEETFIARVWIDAGGQLIRYESDQKDEQAEAAMRAAFLGAKMDPPPIGMPMPIVMRVHRKPKKAEPSATGLRP